MKLLSILLMNLTISSVPIVPVFAETSIEQPPNDLPTVSTAIELERFSNKQVKLVGTYLGTASILSHKKSSSGRTLLVLEAKIVTRDNSQVNIYANAPMLGKFTRSSSEIEKYHDRSVIITGTITKEKKHFSIIAQKIELR